MNLPARLSELADSFIIPLEHYGVISVTGEEKESYLHGQLTVDINKLSAGQARRSAHCDFKGKTWSLQNVVRYDQQILLSLPKEVLDISLAQLNKYGVFSKVDIVDASESLHQVAFRGTSACSWFTDAGIAMPVEPLGVTAYDNGVVIRLDRPDDVFMAILPAKDAAALVSFADQHDTIAVYAAGVFEALSIEQGIPQFGAAHSNEYVPQMMNVQALQGIDFSKGCYMGQEVVARTRYLGRNKRAAYVFKLEAGVSIKPDAIVEKQLGENWRRGGAIIRQATLGQETWLLAVLNNDTTQDDVFRLADAPEHLFSVQPLPYSIDEPKGNERVRPG